MLDFWSKKGMYCLGLFLAFFCYGSIAQINQDIIFKYCRATPDTACFEPTNGAVDTVGRDVFKLGGGYRFCLKIDTIDAGFAPIRVVLVLDRSYSMCQNPRAGACCTDGDGTDSCMMNDPTDKRVEAAQMFVDNLAALSPESEVGVITYETSTYPHNPISLNSAANVQRVKDWIDEASCTSTGYDTPVAMNRTTRDTTPDTTGLQKTAATKATYLGSGLESGLEVSDYNYSSLSEDVKRHIILLTDGAWDDVDTRSPTSLINDYKNDYPDRPVPVIHGVFLSNAELHLAHQFPAEGCSNTDPVVLDNLQLATTLGDTIGQYFSGSTPQTVVDNFNTLLHSMSRSVPRSLTGMVVTNLANGETRNQTSITNVSSGDNQITRYEAKIDDLPIVFGSNPIVVRRFIQRPGTEVTDTVTDTATIFRTDKWTTTVNQEEYAIHCTDDRTTISIQVSPDMRLLNDTFTVNSTIILKENFLLDTVDVRIFARNPDTDPGTMAVYHLDNNLNNSTGDNIGTGSGEVFTDKEMLFGSGALRSGSFSTKIGNLAGDFAFEMWIRPTGSTQLTNLFSIGGFVFGIDNNLKPFAAAGDADLLTSEVPLDMNVWSHIAVSRVSGNIILSVNGLSVTKLAAFDTPLNGAATVTCPGDAILDEIRISNISRLNHDAFADAIRFEVSSVAAPTWIHKNVPYTQQVLTIPPEDWTDDGKIMFNFTSPVDGRLVVNFQHKGTSLASIWSKNGNPVFVAADLDGPFITHAVLTPGPLNTMWDTLQVFFSEVVMCDSLKEGNNPAGKFKVFQFGADGLGGEAIEKTEVFTGSAFLSETCESERADNGILNTRLLISAGAGVVPGRDSILLVGNVVDTVGNYPDPTKFGTIKYGPGSGITIGALELAGPGGNPMILPQGTKVRLGIPENITEAKIVMVQTRAPLVPVDSVIVGGQLVPNYSYRSVIYDAVANVVATDLVLKKNPLRDREYYIVWSGTNLSNRQVSSGAYLLRMRVKYENELDKFVPLQTKFSIKWFADTP